MKALLLISNITLLKSKFQAHLARHPYYIYYLKIAQFKTPLKSIIQIEFVHEKLIIIKYHMKFLNKNRLKGN